MADSMTPVDALQQTLAGEHAALYLYGVLGGQVSRSEQPTLADLVASAYAEHRRRRDRLTTLVAARGSHPVAAQPSYELPGEVDTPPHQRALARLVESRCLGLYAQLVGHSAGADRAWAIAALDAAAVAQLRFGGEPVDFPGSTI